jgi:hypothetical protein
MVHYLYYKLYQVSLKSSLKDIPHIAAIAWLGGLLAVNIIVVNALLSKTIGIPFLFSTPKQGGLFVAFLISLLALYFRKDKRASILERYSLESDQQRKKWNIIIAIYIALSFLSIFAVAFYKPGDL